ncbi:hypothetical protein FNF31_00462 [Cafeteria roenbergensis]|uniref:Uncharacterized protein n=1 Tax=Cafeteria roenbergensis TaxID=33653 RepID=A0A5A8DT18_CAFRO|nr:hypothetical protein FNF31_00462 [Cafeteria roenbergensis]
MLSGSPAERATYAPYQALGIPAAVSNSASSHVRWVICLREDAQPSRVSGLREPLWGPSYPDRGDPPPPAVNAALPARDLFLDVISEDGTPLSRPAVPGEGGETPAQLVSQPRGTALLNVGGCAVIDIEAASLPLSSDFGGALRLVAVFQGRRAAISTPLVVTAAADTPSFARAEAASVPRDGFASMVHVGMSLVHALRKRLRAQGRAIGPSMGGGPRGSAPGGGSAGGTSASASARAGEGSDGVGSGLGTGPSAAGQHPNPSHAAVGHCSSGHAGFPPRMIEGSDSVVEVLDWIAAAVKVAVAKRAAEAMAMSSIMDFGGAETASAAAAPSAPSPASPSAIDNRALREGFGHGTAVEAAGASGQAQGSHATPAGETARAPHLQAAHAADPVRAASTMAVAKSRTPSPASQWQVMLQGPASQAQGQSSPSPSGQDACSPDSSSSKPSAGSSWRPDATPNPARAVRGPKNPIVPPQAVPMPPTTGVETSDRDEAFLGGAVSSAGSLPRDQSALQAGWVRGHAAHTPSPHLAAAGGAPYAFQARSSGDSSFEDYPSSPDSSSYWHRLSSREYVSTTVAALIQALGFERFKTGNLGRDLALVYLHLKPTAQARTGARLAGPRVLSTTVPRPDTPSSPGAAAPSSFTGDAPPSLNAVAPEAATFGCGQADRERAGAPRVLIRLASVGKHKLESEAAKRLRARLISGSVDLSDPTVMTHKSGAAKRRRSALRALITSVLAAAFACGLIDASVLSAPAVRRASSTRRRSATVSSGDYPEFDSDRESSARAKHSAGGADPHLHRLHRGVPPSHVGQMHPAPSAMPAMPGAVQVVYANDPRLAAGGPWGTAYVVDPFAQFPHGMAGSAGHHGGMFQHPQHGMPGPGAGEALAQHAYVGMPAHSGPGAMMSSGSVASSMRRDMSKLQAAEAQAIAEQEAAELEACKSADDEFKVEALDRSTSAAYAAAEAARQAVFEDSADAAARARPLHSDFAMDRGPSSWQVPEGRGRSQTPVGIGLPSRAASKQAGGDFHDGQRGTSGRDDSAFRSHRRILPGATGPKIPPPPSFMGTAIDNVGDEDRVASRLLQERPRQQLESGLQFRGASTAHALPSALPPQYPGEHFASLYGAGTRRAAMPSVGVHPRGVPMQHLAAQLAGRMQGDGYGFPVPHAMGGHQQHQPLEQQEPPALQFRGGHRGGMTAQHSAQAPRGHPPGSAPMAGSMAWFAHPSEMRRHPAEAMMVHARMPSAMPPPSSFPESSHFAAAPSAIYSGHAGRAAQSVSGASASTGLRAPEMDSPWVRPAIAPPSIYHTTLPQHGGDSTNHR